MPVALQLRLIPVDTKYFGNVLLVEFEVNKNCRSQKSLEQHDRCQTKHAFSFNFLNSALSHDVVKIRFRSLYFKYVLPF